jgi:quercetin 2,3-dioxygenase
MINVLRASHRRHRRHRKREVWRTFDPVDGSDRLAAGFGALENLEENRLPPFAEVARYAHGEAEILTYVHEGAVTCEDSLGHAGVIQSGEFACMSEVPGTRHRETNASRSDWAHVFQVRLRAAEVALDTGREQKRFSAAERRGGLCIVASPDARKGSLRLRQDTRVYAALLEHGQHVVHELGSERAAWLHLVRGEIALGDVVLTTGDGAGFTTERAVALTAREDSEILMLDLGQPLAHPLAASDLQSRRP